MPFIELDDPKEMRKVNPLCHKGWTVSHVAFKSSYPLLK